MATLNLGYKIWNSQNFLACCSAGDSGEGNPADVINCYDGAGNPRGASIVPYINCDTGTVRWDFIDNLTEYPSFEGARNGIAITDPNSGIITLWDVSGTANSGEGETPADKLLNFLSACNCVDCDTDTFILEGEYECVYPAFGESVYCYNVTVTASAGKVLELTNIAMKYNAYLVGYPLQTAHVAGGTTTVYRICLNRPIADIGKLPNTTWVLV